MFTKVTWQVFERLGVWVLLPDNDECKALRDFRY
jgi:hypothetical protein